jgi:hypothetical protein
MRLFCERDARRDDCGPLCLRRHDRRKTYLIRDLERQKSRHDQVDAGSYTPAIEDWTATRAGVLASAGVPRRTGTIPQAVGDP